LLATLCPDAERAEGLLWEHGDNLWHESLPRTSSSRLEGGNEMRLGSVFETHDNHEALTRGTMIHGCFELVNWLDEAIPTREQLMAHLKTIDPTIQNFDPFIEDFYRTIKLDNIGNLLSRSTYQETYLLEFAQPGEIIHEANRLEVKNERPFAIQNEDGLLQGIIDRLVLVHQGNEIVAADIIDYKTDLVDQDNLQARIEHYAPQLNGYRAAVSRFARIPLAKISTRLVFTETGQVVNLDLIESSVGQSTSRTSGPKKQKPKQSYGNRKPGRLKKAETKPATNTGPPTPKSKSKPGPAKPADSVSKKQRKLWD